MSALHKISGCDNDARIADVIFVHGLGGDAFATWRYSEDDASLWPRWLGERFPHVGVWSLGYAASPTKVSRVKSWWTGGDRDAGHGMPLPDRALQVLDLMVQRGLGQRPLLFICHSLGGLVAKQVLRRAADASDERQNAVAQQTRAVLFLATPHAGAMLATMLDNFRVVFGATVSVEDLRAHDAHLRELGDWYRGSASRYGIRTVTYYEMRGVRGVKIVDPTSANPGVGANPVGLDEDHLSIAKPRDREAQVFGAACDLLSNFVLVAPGHTNAAGKSPDPEHAPATQVIQRKRLLWKVNRHVSAREEAPELRRLLQSTRAEKRRLEHEIEKLRTNDADRALRNSPGSVEAKSRSPFVTNYADPGPRAISVGGI